MSTLKHSLRLLSIYFILRDDDMEVDDFLTSLEPRALAARAIEAIPTLELIRFKNRWEESYWAHNEGGLAQIMSEGESAFNEATIALMASLKQGESGSY